MFIVYLDIIRILFKTNLNDYVILNFHCRQLLLKSVKLLLHSGILEP